MPCAVHECTCEKKWQPKTNEYYWRICDDGDIFQATWTNHQVDEGRRNFLGIFKTKEEAANRLAEVKSKLGIK